MKANRLSEVERHRLAAEWVEKSCRDQGVPVTVTDVAALKLITEVLRTSHAENNAVAMRVVPDRLAFP